ncbi:MAG: hypothetical protein IJ475_00870 [Bacilli bacterium]|nr:hypothetical protein [Bacilli bacterium]
MKKNREIIDVNEVKDSKIPDDVRVLFGKFTVFSTILIVFLSLIYSLVLVKNLTKFTSIGILVVLFLFYLYMVFDVIRHKGKYSSVLFVVLIISTMLSFGIAILKLFHLS